MPAPRVPQVERKHKNTGDERGNEREAPEATMVKCEVGWGPWDGPPAFRVKWARGVGRREGGGARFFVAPAPPTKAKPRRTKG